MPSISMVVLRRLAHARSGCQLPKVRWGFCPARGRQTLIWSCVVAPSSAERALFDRAGSSGLVVVWLLLKRKQQHAKQGLKPLFWTKFGPDGMAHAARAMLLLGPPGLSLSILCVCLTCFVTTEQRTTQTWKRWYIREPQKRSHEKAQKDVSRSLAFMVFCSLSCRSRATQEKQSAAVMSDASCWQRALAFAQP